MNAKSELKPCCCSSLNYIYYTYLQMLIIFLLIASVTSEVYENEDILNTFKSVSMHKFEQIEPSVSINIFVRNKAHSLPYFLGHIEALNYPKSRIHLYIRVDNTYDRSVEIIKDWLSNFEKLYSSINFEIIEPEILPPNPRWTRKHYEQLIRVRQRGLDVARLVNADFLFSIDADVIILNKNTLRQLIEASSTLPQLDKACISSISIIAPMLNCTSSNVFSNFWGAMSETGYYKRSADYFDIQLRHKEGIFPVALVHSAILINLRHATTKNLAYHPPPTNYAGPIDDLIIFARSAQSHGVKFYLDNREFYGYFPLPLDEDELTDENRNIEKEWRAKEAEYFLHLKLQATVDDRTAFKVLPSPIINRIKYFPIPMASKLGFDQIYLINLVRRPDRLEKMKFALIEQGIDAKLVEAVDGKKLTPERIQELNITQLKGYADPYHKRSLKYGEIGCFLSHYNIWQDMLDNKYDRILILEDDLRFVSGFTRRLQEAIQEADEAEPGWELMYVGRKRMSRNETMLPGSRRLSYPSYTYWTLAYILTRSGAMKLMAQKPLEKLVAVDEFLPIMFNKHPHQLWLSQFEPRNLIAISAEPLLVEPTYYTGEKFYISDTEDSDVLKSETTQ